MNVDSFETVLQIIDTAKSTGFRQLASGAKLYGHVPHVAPEAWLHQLYAPLSEQDIDSVEGRIGQTIPRVFRDFLHLTNGIDLFSGSLSIYGKRSSYARTGDEAWQPFCIVTANTLDKPIHAKPWQLIVGSYRSDGSLISLDVRDGTAFRTRARSAKVLNRWVDFWAMLSGESNRLSTFFDSHGRKVVDGPTTPPSG